MAVTTLWADSLVCIFWMTLAQAKQSVHVEWVPPMCADWRSDVLETILVFIHHTDWIVSIDLEKKNHYIFAGSCPVSIVFLSRTVYTERTFPHPQSGSGARLKKILSRTMFNWRSICSKFNNTEVWLWGRFHWHPKVFQEEYQPNPWLMHIVQSPQINGQIPLELLRKFHHFLMGQLRGASMRSWLMIGWILQCLKQENEDQHWRTDLSETQICTKDFLTENLQEQKMESSISGIHRDPISSKELRVFSSGDFINLSEQGEKTLGWSSGSASFHFSRTVCEMLGWVCCRHPPPQKRRPLTKGYFHSVITYKHWCSLLQVISPKPRESDLRVPFLSRRWMLLLTHLKQQGLFVELFSTQKSSMENPSLRVNRYDGHTNRTFIEEDYIEDEFGQWATDEVTGEQGYVDDEGSCFGRWDDDEYAWQSRPFMSRILKKRGKGKGKGKGGFKGTGRAFLGEEQAQDPEWRSEEDCAWWSKGKRGKKGLSKGNEGFQKGGSRIYPREKGSINDINPHKGTDKDQKGKGKEGAHTQSGLFSLNSETKNVGKVVLFTFRQHLQFPRATCLSYSPFLRWRIWVRQLNWIQKERKLHVQLFACTLLQLNTPQWAILCWIWRVLRTSQNRVSDLTGRRNM